jgi:hypothetical protein
MAEKNIVIAGATFNSVPSIDIPISGGGSASFVEVSDTTAVAADVAQGKYFYTAAGVKTAGTASGAVVQPLSVTGNGTYTPPNGVDGYAPVTVNVSGGGDDPFTRYKNYLEASGTQWINSDYIVQSNTKVVCVANVYSANNAFPSPFAVRAGADNQAFFIYAKFSSAAPAHYLKGTKSGGGYTLPSVGTGYLDQKCEYALSNTGCYIRSAGNIMVGADTAGGAVTQAAGLGIFGQNDSVSAIDNRTFCKGKLYAVLIYEGDTLVHEFIPWQENGVACLKDIVTTEIKYNAGTGNFVYGTDA